MLIGVDDSGRGPVIGPLVLCGVVVEAERESELKRIGVKDSKLLTHRKRLWLVPRIKEKAIAYKSVVVWPREIDARASTGLNLNQLEAVKAGDLINELTEKAMTKGKKGKITAYVDSPSPNEAAWKAYLARFVKPTVSLIVETKADVRYPVVSAASILAKVLREFFISHLKRKYKVDFGSGYTSDPKTIAFLRKQGSRFVRHGLIRESWSTWQRLKAKTEQQKL